MTQPIHAIVCALLASMGLAIASQDGQETPPDMRAMINARVVAQAVHIYAASGEGLPPNIGVLVTQGMLPGDDDQDRDGLSWRANGVPFAYLGVDGLELSDVPDWGEVAIAHGSLDHAFPSRANPDEAIVPVAFLDGHVEMVSPVEARWLIEDARATFAALKGDAPMPKHRQLELDAAAVAQAMRRYANAHDGVAPPDWASVAEFLPETPNKEPLGVFLSPRARGKTSIPAFEDDVQRAAWINANSMWRSQAMDTDLSRVPAPMYTVLVHARPNAWVETPDRQQRKHVRRLAFATADARGDLADTETLEARVDNAHEVFAAVRFGSALPAIDDALHDIEVLARAVSAYARGNDGFLPPDLGEVVPYLGELWGVHDKQPARVFLARHDENAATVDAWPDADWVRENCSYVYLGDGRVRLRDLRGTTASVLIHGPLDRTYKSAAPGVPGEFVPFSAPAFVRTGTGRQAAYLMTPEVLAELAEQSSAAIEQAAGDR
ncbi:MAG: hypothetical protein HRU13_10570 [Phycisphaerales bacterium]|nr:hypothetical protein [Phycisphaerales bacterium]